MPPVPPQLEWGGGNFPDPGTHLSRATVDEGGVALAAIQGLNQKLEAEAKAKDSEIQSLKQSVLELKQLIQSLAAQK